ncbi:MAG TPA: hypothetical protein VFH37_00600 [Candidatus Saccharimonadales bacterium]|nr:hypothetical protein [Candidatus Saccharimonadales bacterium]
MKKERQPFSPDEIEELLVVNSANPEEVWNFIDAVRIGKVSVESVVSRSEAESHLKLAPIAHLGSTALESIPIEHLRAA